MPLCPLRKQSWRRPIRVSPQDLELILTGVVFGFLGQFAQGEIDVTEIVPGIERTVFWLTTAYQSLPTVRRRS